MNIAQDQESEDQNTLLLNTTHQRTRYGDISRTARTGALHQTVTHAVNSVQAGLSRFGEGRYSAFSELDLHWLAFAMLDYVAERTNFSDGIARHKVIKASLLAAREQARAKELCEILDDEGLEVGLSMLFDALCNRGNNYRAFKVEVWDAEQGEYKQRRFWLLKTVFTDIKSETDEWLFELTNEGYIAYFGLMEQDAIDLARINLLRVEMLLDRGAFGEALTLAETNSKQAHRLTTEIKAIRRQIERQIRAVDMDRVTYLGNEGILQIKKLQDDLKMLGTVVRNHIDTTSESTRLNQLMLLSEKLRDQKSATVRLSSESMELPDTFREHQYKLFRRREHMAGRRLPPLESVIDHLGSLPHNQINESADEFLALLNSPIAIDIFDPGAMLVQLDRVMTRESNKGIDAEVSDEDELYLPDDYESSLTPDLVKETRDWLVRCLPEEGGRLSLLIEQALAQLGIDEAIIVQAIAIICLDPDDTLSGHHFDSRPLGESYAIELEDGRRMYGEDLLLLPNYKRKKDKH